MFDFLEMLARDAIKNEYKIKAVKSIAKYLSSKKFYIHTDLEQDDITLATLKRPLSDEEAIEMAKEILNIISGEDMEKPKEAHCPKCGDGVLGDEDGLCGNCSGEGPATEEEQ